MKRGIISDIQRFSVHDGPGIRTNVFFKGCPLSCKWCCNPESISGKQQIGFHPGSCIGCGRCEEACEHSAISKSEGVRRLDISKCADCQHKPCVKVCSPRAITLFGRYATIPELIYEVEKDRIFYENSGGGVTVSGGEPLFQPEFVRDFLAECKLRGLNTAVETSSYCRFEALADILPYVDLFLCDLKHTDSKKFAQYTGGNISVVLENLKRLSSETKNLVIRVPVIPGFNESDGEIAAICEFTRNLGVKDIHFLPYHRLGITKYEKLGADYSMDEAQAPDKQRMEQIMQIGKASGLNPQVGG